MLCDKTLEEMYRQLQNMSDQEVLKFVEGIAKEQKERIRFDRISEEYIYIEVYKFVRVYGNYGVSIDILLKGGVWITAEMYCSEEGILVKKIGVD